MSRNWRFFFIGYVWAGLITLPFLLFVLAFYKPSSWKWHDGVLTCLGGKDASGASLILGKPGGQTWGWLTLFKDEEQRQRADLRVHERCHTVQTFICGPLWLLIYGAMYLFEYAKLSGAGGWHAAYEEIWWETQAKARQRRSLVDLPQPSWRWGALPLAA